MYLSTDFRNYLEFSINPFAAMEPNLKVLPYFNKKLDIEKHFLFLFFLRMRLYIMCHLLYLLYCLNLFVHSMMLLVKTIETKKEICHNQNRRFLFSLLSLCSLLLIVVPCFSRSSQHSVCGHCAQDLPFLRACDQRVCASNDLLIIVWDQVSVSRMAY